MLVKWIRCGVVDRPGFDRAQRRWAALREQPGFCGQGGGWSRSQPGVAHLFGFWDGRRSYDAFMAGPHDGIAAGQEGTFEMLGARLFEHRLDVKVGFQPLFADADLLRVALCKVRPGHADHFTLMQQRVWNPAMAGSPGMLRGFFGQDSGDDFLVLSLWDTATEHGKYRETAVSRLSERAELDADVLSVAGDVVDVVGAWTV
ncbi:YdbC family protein [Actinacidiphila sp. DG2A-62]|uniref:YdbC family protein n=1 Tax=Actinacidiphila sp. DG2A-62 TaxID=3108821 RepID=UPI002DBB10E2|nr:YdbC family protein [Actinacidiphila sp. DG2A-62]MEC3997570.1 YdbC family protein [Actinacidiphila sp. DG2A-62]